MAPGNTQKTGVEVAVEQNKAERDPQKRRQLLLASIQIGAEDLADEQHRRSRVERAKLAAEIAKSQEVTELSSSVIEEAIKKINEEEQAEKAKLSTNVADADKAQIEARLQQLTKERADYQSAKIAVLQAENARLSKTDTFVDGYKKVSGSVVDSVLSVIPEKHRPNLTENEKTVAFTVGTIGLAALTYAALFRGRKAKEAGAEAAADVKAKGGGKLRALLVALGVGGLAFVGYQLHQTRKKYESMADMYEDFKSGSKKKIDALGDQVSDAVNGPWVKYGLDEEQYKKAKDLYETRPDHAPDDIRAIFGLSAGKDSPEFKKFMEDMAEQNETLKINGTVYMRASVAVERYQTDLKIALSQLEQWLENNAFRVMVGTYIAYRIGVLKAILSGGGTVAMKSIQLAKGMAKIGFRHPLLSLLLVGGSAVALHQGKKNLFLPENLRRLVSVGKTTDPIMVNEKGEAVADTPTIVEMRAGANAITEKIAENFPAWVKDLLERFVNALGTTLPEIVGLSVEEAITSRNVDGFKALEDAMRIERDAASTDHDLTHEKKLVVKYDAALQALEDFQNAYIRERCVEFSKSQAPNQAFEKFKSAFAEVDGTATIENGLVKVRVAGMNESWDLCVDPSITDKEKIHELSLAMRQGEVVDTFILWAAVQKAREDLEKGKDKYKNIDGGFPAVAMVVGELLYCVDLENAGNYIMVPIDLVKDLPALSDKNWNGYMASITGGAVTTAMFGLSATALSRVKRLAIGGGPIIAKPGARTILRMIPITSQAELLYGIKQAYEDAKIIKQFGPLSGRVINNVFRQAGLRPEWIHTIANSNDIAALREVGHKMVITGMDKYKDIELLRDFLKTETIDKIKKVQVIDWESLKALKTKTPWKALRIFRLASSGNAPQIFEDINQAFIKKAGGNVPNVAPAARVLTPAETMAKMLLNPKLQKLFDESPEFARFITQYLDNADDPAKFLTALNNAAGKIDDVSVMTKVLQTEKGFARVLKLADSGGDVAGAFVKTSKVLGSLKTVGKAVPVVLDAAAIFGTVVEIMETSSEIEKLKMSGADAERIRLAEQRYVYHGAQLAVSSAGLTTGVLALAGVGATFTGPVAIATLPVSAIIYGAYEGHKWKEDQSRSAKDWEKEYDIVELLTNARTYSFGERVGHGWDLADPLSLTNLALLPFGPVKDLYRLASGDLQKDMADLGKRIQTVDRKKIEAVVAHTTTVSIPETVRDEDGKERPLTTEEAEQYNKMLLDYVKAKVDFLLSQREDAMHVVRSEGSVADLLQNAEYAGLLVRDRARLEQERNALKDNPDAEAKEQAAELSKVLDEKDPRMQAELYGKYLRRRQTDQLYVTLLYQANAQDGNEQLPRQFEAAIQGTILSNAEHAYTDFCVRCEEDNLQDWWPDSDAPKITRLYAVERMKKIAEEKSAELGKKVLAEAQSSKERGIFEFREALQEAQMDIEKFLASPVAVWKEMPQATKDQLAFAFAPRNAAPEQFKKKLGAGETLMSKINANVNGSYYTKQFGWIGNKFLYMTFDMNKGKWLADLGGLGNLRDPASFTCDMAGGSDKYNQLLKDLDTINKTA